MWSYCFSSTSQSFLFQFFLAEHPNRQQDQYIFNTIGAEDMVVPVSQDLPNVDMNCNVDADGFVPSVEEQNLLMNELVFIVASFITTNESYI